MLLATSSGCSGVTFKFAVVELERVVAGSFVVQNLSYFVIKIDLAGLLVE